MDIVQLETVLAVAELGSFSEAAFSLSLSQSSVSKQVSSLEAEFGIRIFNRSSHALTLSPAGEEFLRYAHQTLEAYQSFRLRLAESHFTPRSLSLSVPAVLRLYDILKNIDAFRQCCPGTAVSIDNDISQAAVLSLILKGRLDGAFSIDFRDELTPTSALYLDADDRVRLYPLLCTRYCLVMRRDHPLACRAFVGLEELKDEDIYAIFPKKNARTVFVEACGRCGFVPRLKEVLTVESVLSPAALGAGGVLLHGWIPVPEHPGWVTVPLRQRLYCMLSLMCLKSNSSSALADFVRFMGLKTI